MRLADNLLIGIVGSYRSRWKPLVTTTVAYRLLAFAVLTPIVTALFRAFVAWFSDGVVADEDLLAFFLAPAGWVCLLTIGALWTGIRIFELATLIVVLAITKPKANAVDALRHTAVSGPRLIKLAGRVLVMVILSLIPFLGIAALTYVSLLSAYDINYYLARRPAEFLWACGIGVVLAIGACGVLLTLVTRWLYAVPIVVIEKQTDRAALRESAARSCGFRHVIVFSHLLWAVFVSAVSAFASTLTYTSARLAIGSAGNSLWLLALMVGVSLAVWFLVTTAVDVFAATSLAALHYRLYLRAGGRATLDAETVASGVAINARSVWRWVQLLTWKRLLAGLAVGVISAAVVGGYALYGVTAPDDVQIIAHRGASAVAPENTLAAMKQAIKDQADWVEIDVQQTADGQVVVAHDEDLMRLAKSRLRVRESQLAKLQTIDVGSWFDPNFASERLPSLRQVLDVCRDRVRVNIEIKSYRQGPQLAELVVQEVEAAKMESQIVVMSLDAKDVAKTKELRPKWRVGLLMSVSATRPSQIRADFLAVNAAFVSRSFVRAAHNAGKEVYVWTVNDAVAMSSMASKGVDGIITDKPALARTVLEERARLRPAQRLLLELATLFGKAPTFSEQ